MSQKTFTIIASVIFGVVALFHVLRIFFGWPAVIGGWAEPMWEVGSVSSSPEA